MDEEAPEYIHVFGIEVPNIDDDIQPLECIILIKGIRMFDGTPTMTTIGSNGITPWEAIGMMYTEIERTKLMTIYTSFQNQEDDESPPD